MGFIKKILVGLALIGVIYAGGSSAQSNSLLMQGLGFVGLLAGLIILYVFAKMVLRGLGCMMAILILGGIAIFMMYAFGLFNNGIGGIKDSIMGFIGTEKTSQNPADYKTLPVQKEPAPQPKQNVQPEEDDDDDDDASSPQLFGSVEAEPEEQPAYEPEPAAFNPGDFPAIYASAHVLNADTLVVEDHTLTLFGIDAPEANQTCADSRGRSYNCGQEAANWLKGWIKNSELECHIIAQNDYGHLLGTCVYGPYDLGAALVNAGWAVADTRMTDIYAPYERQAQAARRGLWQGTFYKPWDWRKIQSRKAKIKVLKPQKRLKNIFG